MTLVEAILALRPGLNPLKDFSVVDRSDGNGPFLALWRHDSPRPNDEEIAAIMAADQSS